MHETCLIIIHDPGMRHLYHVRRFPIFDIVIDNRIVFLCVDGVINET